jgi:uncharacterized membrane protein SpoIIM required for sporulation
MKVADIVERRKPNWDELERLCELLSRGKKIGTESVFRFSFLYRSVCADLALAESYQLPPEQVAYLHRLVARSHVQLYRSRGLQAARWMHLLMVVAPKQIYADLCVKICAVLFFGLFTLCVVLGRAEVIPNFAEQVIGVEMIKQMEESFEEPLQANVAHYVVMSGFYIRHNTGIGLSCFAKGIFIIPALFELCFNAVHLGTAFGYMSRDSVASGTNFMQFVTAHGPFELTAIVLSAAAGLRLGVSWIQTLGYGRGDALRKGAVRAIPVIVAAAVLFFLAAITEGFLSPSPLPYLIKALWSIFASGLIMFYFVVLGVHDEGLDGA